MIVHVVLFQPRPDLSEDDARALAVAIEEAAAEIPSVRRFRVGARVRHGAGYEILMAQPFDYAAIAEFNDLAGLQEYLAHPAHIALSERYAASVAAAIVYDYDVEEAADVQMILERM